MAKNPKRPRKSAKRTAAGKPGKETGIDNGMAHFFLGGENKIAGFMHYKPPRWAEEYQKMRVSDLLRRIQDDLDELLARAYPNYFYEWQQKFAPNYFPMTYERRLRTVIHESIAESLCPGLMQRIRSKDNHVRKPALMEYARLVDRLLTDEPKHAANALAFITKSMATYLENLFVKRNALMREVAGKYDLWPVNLGLKDRIVKGEMRREVQRREFARDYLIELGLNSEPRFPSGHASGAQPKTSPFKLAAEELYTKMLMLKDDPKRHVEFPKVTPWAKRLFALTVPMTKSNAADWWQAAKIYLYERWDKAQEEFEPLIKRLSLTLSSKTPYPSTIKTRVVDNALKEAFEALAQSDL